MRERGIEGEKERHRGRERQRGRERGREGEREAERERERQRSREGMLIGYFWKKIGAHLVAGTFNELAVHKNNSIELRHYDKE